MLTVQLQYTPTPLKYHRRNFTKLRINYKKKEKEKTHRLIDSDRKRWLKKKTRESFTTESTLSIRVFMLPMKNFAVWWIRCQLGSTESNTSVYDPGIKKIIQRVKIFRKSIDTCCLLSVIGYQWPRIVTSNHKPEVWTPPSPKQHDIIQKKKPD